MERWAVDRVVSLIFDEALSISDEANDEYKEYLNTGKPSRCVTALQIANTVTCLYEVAVRLYKDLANDCKEEE